jgi:hypothetical protein
MIGDASHTGTCSTHDGLTTIVSDNDLVTRDTDPPLDITTIIDASRVETQTQNYRWERTIFLSLYFLTIFILFSDMNLLAPNLTM